MTALIVCSLGCAPVPGTQPRLLVKPRGDVPLQQLDTILGGYNARRVDAVSRIGVHVFELPAGADVPAILRSLNANVHIEFAESDERVAPHGTKAKGPP